jgi:hypothetical protein
MLKGLVARFGVLCCMCRSACAVLHGMQGYGSLQQAHTL